MRFVTNMWRKYSQVKAYKRRNEKNGCAFLLQLVAHKSFGSDLLEPYESNEDQKV